MPKAWRRTVRDGHRGAAALLSATFVLATRVLTLVFDRPMTVTSTVTSSNLIVFSGTNRYNWASTTTPAGYSLVFGMAVGVGDATPQKLQWLAVPACIRDSFGTIWPAGNFTVNIV